MFFLLHLAMENIFQLAARLTHAGDLRIVRMVRHQLAQHTHIKPTEMQLRAVRLMRVHSQTHQRFAAQLQRAGKGFTRELCYPRLQ